MMLGAKIQKYRKQFGMSQDELGQKLLVSRQTISLWEKDQTVPTIDNLMRLKEVFDVSMDELLGIEGNQVSESLPDEEYRFAYSEAELFEIYRMQRKKLCRQLIPIGAISAFWLIAYIFTSVPPILAGAFLGAFLFEAACYVKGIFTYKKEWQKTAERICASVYEYRVFPNYIDICVYRNDEVVLESKCYHSDMEQIRQEGGWLIFQFRGQAFLIKKGELREDSAFLRMRTPKA